jgi:hypothetical protein
MTSDFLVEAKANIDAMLWLVKLGKEMFVC